MSFEKTIEELNTIRNKEYDRLRYDRSVWEGNYQGTTYSMLYIAQQDVRTPDELDMLERTKRMIDFYGTDPEYKGYEVGKEELQDLMELYDKELPKHQKATEKALNDYKESLQALEDELRHVLDKHSDEIKARLSVLAELQRDEAYLYDSKGLPTEFSGNGITDYYTRAGRPTSSIDRCLTGPDETNYLYLHHHYDVLERMVLKNLAKEGK